MGFAWQTVFLISVICTLLNFGLPRAIAAKERDLNYASNLRYNYHYETEVYFNEKDASISSKATNDVGFKFSANVQISSAWNDHTHNLMKLNFVKCEIHSVARSQLKHDLRVLEKYPLYFLWDGNHVSKIYAAKGEEFLATNMKIAVSNLFQLHRGNIKRKEIDINGECDVEYRENGSQLTKIKRNCKKLHRETEFHNINRILDVGTQSNLQVIYDIQNNVIQSAITYQQQSTWVEVSPDISTSVTCKQILSLVNTAKGLSKIQSSSVKEAVSLLAIKNKMEFIEHQSTIIVPKVSCSGNSCSRLSDVVKNNRGAIKEAAKTQTSSTFLILVNVYRKSKKNNVLASFQNPKNKNVIPVLIDVAVAAQTTDCQEALMEFIDFQSMETTLAERYLLAAALSTHPPVKLLNDLHNLYKTDLPSDTLEESVGNAMGAVLYTYSRQNKAGKLIIDIQKDIIRLLEACKDVVCKTQHLRVLTNAAIPDTIPILLKYAETSKETIVSETALKALRRFDKIYFNDEVRESLIRIIHQMDRKFDSCVRTTALSYLIELGITQNEIKSILETTGDLSEGEFNKYIQEKLKLISKNNSTIDSFMTKALTDNQLGNYNILAPKGKALVFKSNLMNTGNMQASYDMYVENSKAGIMKRSGMDVNLMSKGQSLPIYSFGIFAAGLEGLLGKAIEPGNEDVEATAGLALNMADVSLRPVTFFTGQSGLMSAVWNAPSQLVSALQANFLLQDYKKSIILSNGLLVEQMFQGAISVDLSGLCSISLWYKTCNSVIKNSGAVTIKGYTNIDTEFFKTGITVSGKAASLIDFITDVDFSDGIKMCLQMKRPTTSYNKKVLKFERSKGFKKAYVAKTNKNYLIEGVDYLFPRENDIKCRELLGSS